MTHKAFVNKSYVRLRTMTLAEGLIYINTPQRERMIDGFWIENVAKVSATRLRLFGRGDIQCVSCGLKGSHFHIERHVNDKVMPFSVNLYGVRDGQEIMLTWDHIVPRSMEGSNNIANAQPMCSICNNAKSSDMSFEEIMWAVTHPNPLVLYRTPPYSFVPLDHIIEKVSKTLDFYKKEESDDSSDGKNSATSA